MPCSLAIRSLDSARSRALVRLDLSGELVTCEGARTVAAVLQALEKQFSVAFKGKMEGFRVVLRGGGGSFGLALVLKLAF